MIEWRSHIESNPSIMYGKPVIKHTRIPADLILEKLSEGETIGELLEAYPRITQEDVFAVLAFAAESI
jgi:uncharacterized protein (DUF433 family)